MAPETLTDYERRRQDNIRRNEKMMETLKLQSTSAELSPFKPRRNHHKNPPLSSIRRSLRARGLSPKSFIPEITNLSEFLASPLSDRLPPLQPVINSRFNPRSLVLRPEHSAVLLPKIISSIRFLPFSDRTVVVAGNAVGNLGFWVVDSSNGPGMYACAPHSSVITGISAHNFSASRIFTSSYDRSVRLMDFEKEEASLIVCSSVSDSFHSISQWLQDANSLYIGEGEGKLKVWDERAGKASSFWLLHERRINMVDFSLRNSHLVATGSSDGTACIWDLRLMKKGQPEYLKRVVHERAVHSAYFSPSGSCLATTSDDDRVGILSGSNFEDQAILCHKNRGVKLLSPSRGIWGWDDSYLFLGNLDRAIDVIFIGNRTTVALESPEMNATPQCLAVHPYILGSLATATSGGKVFLWTKD